ncbi:MAG TPA: hypothetical protein VMT46_14970 [Anaerolineaceae bacterium]|nr:hypothetical protein [Anaerolineaceae bacterium]
MGDRFSFRGDFRGSILNIKSELKNVQQSVGKIPTEDESTKLELQKLIQQLSTELEKAPPEKQEDTQAVVETAKALVDQANAPRPNKTLLQISGEGLKQAAKNLADVTPTILSIATQIVMAVARITGTAG